MFVLVNELPGALVGVVQKEHYVVLVFFPVRQLVQELVTCRQGAGWQT